MFKLIIEFISLTILFAISIWGLCVIYWGYIYGNIPWMIFGVLLVIYTEIWSIYKKLMEEK